MQNHLKKCQREEQWEKNICIFMQIIYACAQRVAKNISTNQEFIGLLILRSFQKIYYDSSHVLQFS